MGVNIRDRGCEHAGKRVDMHNTRGQAPVRSDGHVRTPPAKTTLKPRQQGSAGRHTASRGERAVSALEAAAQGQPEAPRGSREHSAAAKRPRDAQPWVSASEPDTGAPKRHKADPDQSQQPLQQGAAAHAVEHGGHTRGGFVRRRTTGDVDPGQGGAGAGGRISGRDSSGVAGRGGAPERGGFVRQHSVPGGLVRQKSGEERVEVRRDVAKAASADRLALPQDRDGERDGRAEDARLREEGGFIHSRQQSGPLPQAQDPRAGRAVHNSVALEGHATERGAEHSVRGVPVSGGHPHGRARGHVESRAAAEARRLSDNPGTHAARLVEQGCVSWAEGGRHSIGGTPAGARLSAPTGDAAARVTPRSRAADASHSGQQRGRGHAGASGTGSVDAAAVPLAARIAACVQAGLRAPGIVRNAHAVERPRASSLPGFSSSVRAMGATVSAAAPTPGVVPPVHAAHAAVSAVAQASRARGNVPAQGGGGAVAAALPAGGPSAVSAAPPPAVSPAAAIVRAAVQKATDAEAAAKSQAGTTGAQRVAPIQGATAAAAPTVATSEPPRAPALATAPANTSRTEAAKAAAAPAPAAEGPGAKAVASSDAAPLLVSSGAAPPASTGKAAAVEVPAVAMVAPPVASKTSAQVADAWHAVRPAAAEAPAAAGSVHAAVLAPDHSAAAGTAQAVPPAVPTAPASAAVQARAMTALPTSDAAAAAKAPASTGQNAAPAAAATKTVTAEAVKANAAGGKMEEPAPLAQPAGAAATEVVQRAPPQPAQEAGPVGQADASGIPPVPSVAGMLQAEARPQTGLSASAQSMHELPALRSGSFSTAPTAAPTPASSAAPAEAPAAAASPRPVAATSSAAPRPAASAPVPAAPAPAASQAEAPTSGTLSDAERAAASCGVTGPAAAGQPADADSKPGAVPAPSTPPGGAAMAPSEAMLHQAAAVAAAAAVPAGTGAARAVQPSAAQPGQARVTSEGAVTGLPVRGEQAAQGGVGMPAATADSAEPGKGVAPASDEAAAGRLPPAPLRILPLEATIGCLSYQTQRRLLAPPLA